MRNTNNTTDVSRRDKALPCLYRKSRSRNLSGFTLVELIVVITILAILGVIAFTQMGGFQGNARDSDRITTLSQLDSGLELSRIKLGTYPMPETNSSGVILTGSIDGTIYSYLGVIGDTISRNLKMSKTPVDPASTDKYVYATNSTRTTYQIAATLENALSFSPSPLGGGLGWGIVNAATPAQARVNGNYPGYLKFLSGSTTYITNVPSLIWYATGVSVSLTANPTTTYFVVNKQNNLPYRFNSTDTIQNQNANQIIQSVTGYSTATLTLTGITSLTATGIEAQFGTSATLSPALASFGGDLTKLTTALLGTTATTGSQEETPTNSCATQPTYTHATFTVGTPTSVGQTWQNTNISNPCYYVCTDGYTGADCSVPPPLITQADCTGANWIWVPNTDDVYIGTAQGNGFCISPIYGDWNADSTLGNGGISWNGWGNYALDYYNGWNASSIDDTGNPYPEYGQTKRLDSEVTYNCKALGTATSDYITSDTIAGRMKWLATTGNSYTEARSIDWITGLVPHTVGTYPHAIPSIYIADCIDGVKDLTTTMTYKHSDDTTANITYAEYNTDVTANTDTALLTDTTYQNRQKYLTAWTQKSGSHLPSAFSSITSGYASATDADGDFLTGNARGEYQMACDTGKFGAVTYNGTTQYTGAPDDTNNEWIWLAAVGNTVGSFWGLNARIVGNNGCGDQNNVSSGNRNSYYSARFVVRP